MVREAQARQQRRASEQQWSLRVFVPPDQQIEHRGCDEVVQGERLERERPLPHERIRREDDSSQCGEGTVADEAQRSRVDHADGQGPADHREQVDAKR